jgi:hypothetical protein
LSDGDREKELAPGAGVRRVGRAAWVAGVVFVAVVVVAIAHQYGIGQTQAAAAESDAGRGDWTGAIMHARAAAEAAAPGSRWPDEGFRRLEAIGHDAEARADGRTALVAYGAMLTAASDRFGMGAWHARAEVALARLGQRDR